MLLIHKYFKYVVGWQNPSHVIYCNRKSSSELTVADLREYMLDVVENCRRFGAPYGAMIRLAPEAQAFQSSQVQLAELFVVCHEIGHFLNGDLKASLEFRAFEGHDWVNEYVENRDHEKEYGADARAFELMMSMQGASGRAAVHLLPTVISLFNLFYLLGARTSETHPHPLERSVRIAERFFGKERAEALKRSYDDPNELIALLKD